jgi:hypothetical protein
MMLFMFNFGGFFRNLTQATLTLDALHGSTQPELVF